MSDRDRPDEGRPGRPRQNADGRDGLKPRRPGRSAQPGRPSGSGEPGRLSLKSGTELKPKGLAVVPPGDRLVVEMPGGGGMGPPQERDAAAIERDVRLGYVSREAARRDYGAG